MFWRAFVSVLLLAVGAGISPDAFAQSTVRVPPLTASLVDEAALLSANERTQVIEMLRRLEATGKAQMAVLIPRSLQGFEIESYAIAVVESWQLGKKANDSGLLLVIAPNERRMRLEVGYGLEGEITDAFSRQVLDGTVVPYFREQRYGDGLMLAIERIAGQIGADLQAPVGNRIVSRRSSEPDRFFWVIFLVFFVFPLIVGRRRRSYHGWSRTGHWGGRSTHWGGGGTRGGGFGGGGFRGGGGRFGGGGASSGW